MELQPNTIKKTCQLCGEEFYVSFYENRAKYCAFCKAKAMRRNQKRYRKKQKDLENEIK